MRCMHTGRASWRNNNNNNKVRRNSSVLELLQGLVVQVETGVSSQVQLLELGRQILR